MKKKITVETTRIQSDSNLDWLFTSGNKIIDNLGNRVRFTGVNWFGFETDTLCLDGLWAIQLEKALDIIANLGFNVIRVPICVQLIWDWINGVKVKPLRRNLKRNFHLLNKSSLEIFDHFLTYCKQIGLKIILCMFRLENKQMSNLWFSEEYPIMKLYTAWEWLALRYKDNDTIIAMDIFNEPHGVHHREGINAAKWDNSTDPSNWKVTAEILAQKIHTIHPNVLIIIEGIQSVPIKGCDYTSKNEDNYDVTWWGANLRGYIEYPINLPFQNKIIYEIHEYGPSVYLQPWFKDTFTYESLYNNNWKRFWFFIHLFEIAPIYIGEWGSLMNSEIELKWFNLLADFIKKEQLNFTFWCFNPNSGDTGGILKADWKKLNEEKYHMIKPTLWLDDQGRGISLNHQQKLGSRGISISDFFK